MNRPVRIRGLVFLLVLMIVAAIGTVTQDIRFDKSLGAERASAVAIDRAIESALLALADLRTAQAGYVASGQGAAFWMTRVSDLSAGLADAIGTLKSTSSSAAAISHYDAAAAAFASSRSLTGARSLVRTEQRPLASDAIFMNGLGITLRATHELADAREVERAASEAAHHLDQQAAVGHECRLPARGRAGRRRPPAGHPGVDFAGVRHHDCAARTGRHPGIPSCHFCSGAGGGESLRCGRAVPRSGACARRP